jgi:hypothetical protein
VHVGHVETVVNHFMECPCEENRKPGFTRFISSLRGNEDE